MNSSEPVSAPLPDLRAMYGIAVAVAQQILELCPHYRELPKVWHAFATWQGRNLVSYYEAVQRTRHYLFHYELQQLINFGVDVAPTEFRENFSFLAGRKLGANALEDTLYPLLGGLGQHPDGFQAGLVDMIRMYLVHYASDEFVFTAQSTGTEIILEVTERLPDRAAAYFNQYGLDPPLCFRHDLQLIGGALDTILSAVIRPWPASGVQCLCKNRTGSVHLPIAPTSRFDYERLMAFLLRFLKRMQTRQQLEIEERELQDDLVIASAAMSRTWDCVRRASRSNEIVLLLGESGTGKTFIAQKIHELSRRRDGPFIQVGLTADLGSENLIQSNLFGHERGAFTGATERKQGLFSLAHGGSIFLDEIGDAPPEVQAKLLRVIETGTFKRLGGVEDVQVDVRIITATNRNLEEMVRNKAFRQDLYFRLNVIPIYIPALRERPESIPALANFLLSRINAAGVNGGKRFAPGLVEQLQAYPWPGNIRELDHALKHAVAMSDAEAVDVSSLPARIRDHLQGKVRVQAGPATRTSAPAPVINLESLRRAIQATDPLALSQEPEPHCFPAHIDYARKQYLSALIDTMHGDLALIGHFFDRGSEKTLRHLIRSFDLEPALQAARSRPQRSA